MEQHAKKRPDKATCLHITLTGGRELCPVKLFSASPSAGLFQWIHASPRAALWPAGLLPPACCCQSWVRGDTVVRGGEELRNCASEPLSPSSAVQVIQWSSSWCWCWDPTEGGTGHYPWDMKKEKYAGQLAAKCKKVVWKTCSSPGRSQKRQLAVMVPSGHPLEESPDSCPKTLAWAHASHVSAPSAW